MKYLLFFLLGIGCASLIIYYLPDIPKEECYHVVYKNDSATVYKSNGYVGKCKVDDLPALLRDDNIPIISLDLSK